MKKVLLIDADADYQDMVRGVLENAGYIVDTQSEGEAGFRLARKNEYDLVILNVELPDVNGYALCKRFRTEEKTAGIPLILTSELATREDFDKHRRLKVRADDYLHKPYSDDQLLKKVENLIGFKISEEEFLKLQEQFEQVLSEKAELERTVKDYEDLRTSLENRIDELLEKVRALESDLKETKHKLEERERELEALEERCNRYQELKAEIKNLLGTVVDTIAELKEKIELL